jgi:hypothetical protein
MIWGILAVAAVVGLIFFWRGPNAVWGGATIGLVFGLIVALIDYSRGLGFYWQIVGKSLVVCTSLGAAIELLSRILRRSN